MPEEQPIADWPTSVKPALHVNVTREPSVKSPPALAPFAGVPGSAHEAE